MHHLFEVFPAPAAPKIVHQERAAVGQVSSQGADLRVAQFHPLGMRHENEGKLSQRRVGQFQNAAIGVGSQGGEQLEAGGEIEVGVGIVVDPAQPARSARGGFKNDAGEDEHVLLKAGRVGPRRQIDAVGRRFARGADGFLVDPFATLGLDEGAEVPGAKTAIEPELRGAQAGPERRGQSQKRNSSRGRHDSVLGNIPRLATVAS